MRSPSAKKSTSTVQNMSHKTRREVPWYATAYDSEAAAVNSNNSATNAGSSRAHWFFVSVVFGQYVHTSIMRATYVCDSVQCCN